MLRRFFVGIEPQTTTLTRLNYAYDLRIFFDYLLKNVRAFRDYQDVLDFTAEDLDKVTLGNLEAYMEYLSYYTFEGKEKTNAEKGKSRKISTVRTFSNTCTITTESVKTCPQSSLCQKITTRTS